MVNYNSDHKKAKDVNTNYVETISQNEYKDVSFSLIKRAFLSDFWLGHNKLEKVWHSKNDENFAC